MIAHLLQNAEVLKAKNQVDDTEVTEGDEEEQSIIDNESGSSKEKERDDWRF